MAKQRDYLQVAALAAGGSKQATFTYRSDRAVPVGQLVRIGLGSRPSMGVVVTKVARPKFTTKPIAEIFPLPPLPQHLLKLANWMSDYYATPLGRVWQTLLPPNPFVANPRPATTPALASQLPVDIELVEQQQAAVANIKNSRDRSYLLYGATGSGKTQVYIELAESALEAGRSTIMLVPEIALTPQISAQFLAQFGDRVILTHSALTPAARRQIWQSLLTAAEPKIVIGPRSALFAPLAKLAYVIIDEAHDSSYKQDQAPRYQAASVAAELARLTKAKLILGTATPAAGDMFLARHGRLKLVHMPDPIFKAHRTPTQIVDLKDKSQLSSSHFVSKSLLKALRQTLDGSKQSLLFLNRRGSARAALCAHCGWIATCPNCQIPLTWHADQGQLRCHWCDFHQTPPTACPDCGRFEIRFVGGGTKRIETEVQKLLPEARIERLDRDSFDGRTINQLYQRLRDGEVDILIGTQMITKGLDLPGVETVGIMLADTMLYLPDFTSAERTFQLLYQVSGRAGRRDNTLANVVIQTYSPNHPAIVAAATGNYQKFIDEQLTERKLLNYPPFVYLLKLSVARATRQSAQAAAKNLLTKIKSSSRGGIALLGPAPSWRETLGGKYHWQIIVKSKVRSRLVEIAKSLPPGWVHDLDPIDLL